MSGRHYAAVVDKTELKKAVDAAKEFASSEENKEKYTEDSWKTLEDAMKAAQDVLDKPEAAQKEVDDALTALTEAKENLNWYFNFTGCIVETALKSLRLSCGSELTRQGISLP